MTPEVADPAKAVESARRPGRPREARVNSAVVQATLELFVAEGYHALTVEAVALRAGVGKATIYRRWPGKRELVIDSFSTLVDDLPDFPGQNTRDRLLAVLQHMSHKDPGSLAGRIMPRMLGYRLEQPDLYAGYFTRVVMPRRAVIHGVLRDGIACGELRADLDVELTTLALVGPVMLQFYSVGPPEMSVDLPDRLLDLLWPGLQAADTAVKPAHPPALTSA